MESTLPFIDAIRQAIVDCEYDEYDIKEKPSTNNRSIHLAFFEKDSQECTVMLEAEEMSAGEYVVNILCNFYSVAYFTEYIDDVLHPYLIRNATKIVDDPESHAAFFEKFFDKNPHFLNTEELNKAINDYCEEQIRITYVINHTNHKVFVA